MEKQMLLSRQEKGQPKSRRLANMVKSEGGWEKYFVGSRRTESAKRRRLISDSEIKKRGNLCTIPTSTVKRNRWFGAKRKREEQFRGEKRACSFAEIKMNHLVSIRVVDGEPWSMQELVHKE